MRGVPLRIEIGPRDIDNGVVMGANRFGVKEQIQRDSLVSGVVAAMDTFTGTLREQAEEHTNNHITLAPDLGTAAKAVEDGAAVVHWCGSKDCADRIEEELDVSILGTHIRSTFITENEGPCPVCGKPGKPTLVGRSY
jgi:prolyl-tRNA synthetase